MSALFVALFVQMNYWQVVEADKLSNAPGNTRVATRDFARPRGVIQTADGVVVAKSVDVADGFKRQRQYPAGPLYAPITGFFSFTYGTDGVERTYAAELAGRAVTGIRNLGEALTSADRSANVTLTIRNAVQDAAAKALGTRRGAVVALDPTTGAVLALVTSPSYDPNPLAAHDQHAVRAAWDRLQADPTKPLLPRAYRERYAPGSTFKVVTAAAALDRAPELVTRAYPVLRELTLPQTDKPLPNFDGKPCGGRMPDLLRVSCNTGFGQIGLDLGGERLSAQAHDFGFGDRPPFDLPGAARSQFPDAAAFVRDLPALAKSAIGQQDVVATPLQMALTAGAVGNGGVIMEPHVMAEIRDHEGAVVRTWAPRPWRRALSPGAAAALRDMMVGVVTGGSGRQAAVPGVAVAGKTGTAQTTGNNAHAWMIAFAPAEAPRVAVAVIVESQPSVTEATGGRVAAPIARAVLQAALSSGTP
jgi:peptidoglycan glycosyltransferase